MSTLRTLSYILLTLMALQACKTRPPGKGDVIHFPDGPVPKPDTAMVIIDTIPDDTSYLALDTTDTELPVLKSSYKLAIVLPLMEDSVKGIWNRFNEVDYNDFLIPNAAMRSISFIKGLQSAAEGYNGEAELELLIYDCGVSNSAIGDLLDDLKNDSVDVVIGGVKKNQAIKLADFCKANKLPFLSAFTPSLTVTSKNPYYIQLVPSIDRHLEAMLRFVIRTMPESNIKVFYEDNERGAEFAAVISRYLAAHNDTIENVASKTDYALIPVGENAGDRRGFKIGEHLDYESDNAVFIPSFSDGFIHALMTQLSGRANTYDLTLFGLPTWTNSETARLEYFNSLNLHTSSAGKLMFDEKDSKTYKSSDGESIKLNDPDELMGYDLFNCLSGWLNDYGRALSGNLTGKPCEGLSYLFDITPIYTDEGELNRYENRHLNILRLEDYELIHAE